MRDYTLAYCKDVEGTKIWFITAQDVTLGDAMKQEDVHDKLETDLQTYTMDLPLDL